MTIKYSLKLIAFLLLIQFNSIGQSLGIYEFSGSGICPNPYTEVTVQPQNIVFSNYSSVGTNCSATNDVFNNSSWNTTGIINLDEYNQFSLASNSCFDLSLTSLTFSHRVSNVSSVPTWHIRSSVDNFTTDIGSGTSATTLVASTINLPSIFTHLKNVTFRFYLTGATASSTTWRNDNVSVAGTINAVVPQIYYMDADGDTFGNPDSTILACELPSGFVANNLDCNDTNTLINPVTIWFADLDEDGFGDSLNSFTGCVPSQNYVLNNVDCDDQNATITFAIDTFYRDNDGDGFGDSILFQVACSQPIGYVTNKNDCDDSDSMVTLAATIYYTDFDGDGFGNPLDSILLCRQIDGYVLDKSDCDDANSDIYPAAPDLNGNGIDENCDGVDGYLGISEIQSPIFRISPNPSDGHFVIVSSAINGGLIIRLLDLNGTILSEQNYSNELCFTDFSAGTYLLQIITKDMVSNYRIVIHH